MLLRTQQTVSALQDYRFVRPHCSRSISATTVQAFDSNAFGDGAVLGCDFVGEVVELGSEATRLAKGDIVAGLVWGGKFLHVG